MTRPCFGDIRCDATPAVEPPRFFIYLFLLLKDQTEEEVLQMEGTVRDVGSTC